MESHHHIQLLSGLSASQSCCFMFYDMFQSKQRARCQMLNRGEAPSDP
jgi:hypothetical protein